MKKYLKLPETSVAVRDKNTALRRKYGVDVDWYKEKLKEQNEACDVKRPFLINYENYPHWFLNLHSRNHTNFVS